MMCLLTSLFSGHQALLRPLLLRLLRPLSSLQLVSLLFFFQVGLVQANVPEPLSHVASPSTHAVTQVEEQQTLNLVVKQGRLLTLPRAVSSVLVADPEVANFQLPSPRNLFVFAKGAGTTTLYALDARDRVVAAIEVIAQHDLEALTQAVESEVPDAQVRFAPASGNGLVVRGHVRTPQQAKHVMQAINAFFGGDEGDSGGGQQQGQGGGQGSGNSVPRIINQLNVELSAQVNISVRIVEVSRSLSTDLGLNWELTLKGGDYFFRNGTALFDSATNSFIPDAMTSGIVAGGTKSIGSASVGGLLNALSSDGLATVLAEPNLTAMSGETAGFAAGGEVPIVIVTNNNVTIDYKQYGVIMRMTPTLLSPNRISLHIAPEVSDLSNDGAVTFGGNQIPAFKVRRADTTVELASGQSFALAGMLRSSSAQEVSGVPGLRDIPGLGRLFETERNRQEDTELVIIATAYVVEPSNAGDFQTPGQGIETLDAATLPPSASAGYLF